MVNKEKDVCNHSVGAKLDAGVIFDLDRKGEIRAIVTAGAKAACAVDGKPLDPNTFCGVKTKNGALGYTYGGSAALQIYKVAKVKVSVFAEQGENGKQIPAGQVSLTLGFNEDCASSIVPFL